MFTVFLENKLLSAAFLILLLLSIICQIMIGVIYRKMLVETDNMSSTVNRNLKQCKLKFANCFKLNEGVANIPVFVDKFLSKVTVLGISLTGMQHLAGQFMLLAIVAAGAGACHEIIQGETVGKVLPYYIVGFLGLYVYFSVSGLVDIQGKRERLKVNLVDYLENHMANKLRQSAADWEELTGEKSIRPFKEEETEEKENETSSREKIRALREEIGLSRERREIKPVKPLPEAADSAMEKENIPEKKRIFTQQEEQELEELLREFLV